MASVAPPKPGYRPHVLDRLVTDCVLSDAQLESLIYAGEAHAGFLARPYAFDEPFDALSAVDPVTPGPGPFRLVGALADGTRAGKGRPAHRTLPHPGPTARRRPTRTTHTDQP